MNDKKLNIIRKKILNESKEIISEKGWNEKLFKSISLKKNIKYVEISSLFPQGYIDLLIFYLDQINIEMTLLLKKQNLDNLKTHQKIKQIIISRLNIYQDNRKLFNKTFIFLSLPQNSKLAIKSLYKTIDLIWFLAGDKSTDFNFYTKRSILAGVYISTVFNFFRNKDLNIAIDHLDRKLRDINKIPKIKNKFKSFKNFFLDLSPI
tara:strand:- start:54 stop:671 length:618 start_codon:yes stop_codon:yes gene_type:complete